MAKPNPFDRNVSDAQKPQFVSLEYIEDVAIDEGDPLAVLLACEQAHLDGDDRETLENWHASSTCNK